MSVCVCVCVSTLSSINISETSGRIAIKFYLKHYWGRGKAALGFRPDQIRTLVSMETDSYYWVIMGNILLAPLVLIGSSSFSLVRRTTIKSRMNLKFDPIRPRTAELAALERLKKIPYTYKWRNIVSTLAPSFLLGSTSYLQVTSTTIKAWMSSKFGLIPLLTTELGDLECLKNLCLIL